MAAAAKEGTGSVVAAARGVRVTEGAGVTAAMAREGAAGSAAKAMEVVVG